MDVKILEKDKENKRLILLVKKTTPSLVNALRRTILERVPTMAIEDVELRKNSSILYDEIIAHRLGLIPLTTDLKSYNFQKDCKCGGVGCSLCTLKLSLTAKGQGIVYSSKLKSQDPKVIPINENIPIVKLFGEQQLQLEATAILGTGEMHSKWSPGHVYYKNMLDIEVKKQDELAKRNDYLCPAHIAEYKGKSIPANKEKILTCNLCYNCIERSSTVFDVEPDAESFIFTIESFGQLEPKEMVAKALDVLEESLDQFTDEIKKT